MTLVVLGRLAAGAVDGLGLHAVTRTAGVDDAAGPSQARQVVDVHEERRTRYRLPVTATIVPFVPLLVVGLVLGGWGTPAAAAVFFVLATARGRGLELTQQVAVVRNLKAEGVAWSSVTAVRSGGWRGGVVLTTASWRDVWSPAPCSWWGGPAPPAQVAEIERWWIEHRGPAWTPAPAVALFPPKKTPPVRYRTATVASPVAVLGLLVGAVNGAALWWPLGGFTMVGVEFTEPSLDGLGWSIVAAVAAGTILGAWWAVKAHRLLTRGGPPPAASNTMPGDAARPLMIAVGAAVVTAIAQWLGVAPAMGSLTMVGVGVAATLAGLSLAAGARRFEDRTGRLLLSTNPLARGFGLETGPPRSGPSPPMVHSGS